MKIVPAFLRALAFPLAGAALLLASCSKKASSDLNEQEEESVALASAEAQTESETIFNDVFDNVVGVNSEVGLSGTGIFARTSGSATLESGKIDSISPCLTLSVTRLAAPALFPVRITLDFGAGCLGRDGHFRKGKVSTVYTGRLLEPGKSATTTFEGYSIDSISVQGTHRITNTTTGQRQFTVEVEGGRLTQPGGNQHQWNSRRVITQVQGEATLHPADDVLQVTGNSSGSVQRGDLLVNWSGAIEEPLWKRFTCRWISKGVVVTQRDGLPSGTAWKARLDFGTGDCDNKAVLTIHGKERQITLH